MDNKTSNSGKSKFFKFIFLVGMIFVIGGIGGAFIDRYLFPELSQYPFFSKCAFLKKVNENVTIIEKTEQVMVREEDSIQKVISRPSSGMVNILSIGKDGTSQNGSGFVVASDGLIITYSDAIFPINAEYKVFIFDGSEYSAELVGIDKYSNLAYLRIQKSNLPVVSFSNSDEVNIGKKVILLGNSNEEYQNQVSTEIISSFENTFNLAGKTMSFSDKLEGVFETGADTSNRFVGGPVVDYNGDVIGLVGKVRIDNVDRYFAIPSNEINRSIDLAIAGKIDTRATLGIYYIPLNKSYSSANSIAQEKGAYIYSPSGRQGLTILSGSKGEAAKFIFGDIIISVDGKEINSDNPLSEIVSRYQIGDKANFKIIRSGKEIDIEVAF
ncbi:MAG: S1C family serine protease [Candidatus Moranbacteria bacterium]|jgi:serine protease Do|nr:S1C family serine protease [Candidatus Moranbacteria bacterium]